MNGRTQYARNGDVWSRILVPNGEQNVSVLEFRPGNGEYVVTRYALDADTMTRIRALRRGVASKCIAGGDVSACRRKIERERNRVNEESRRTVVETPADKGAGPARKHPDDLVRTITSLQAARHRRSASHWAESRRPRRVRRSPWRAE